MAIGTLASRILGFIKGMVLGVAVGGSAVADLFDTANNVPNIIYLLVAGGVFNAVLIPQIIKASKQPDRGADFISRVLTLAVLVLLGLTVLVTLAAGPIMDVLTTDFSQPKLALVTAFATLLLPQIFFYGLYSLLGQVLNAHGAFKAYAWAPVVNNIVAIAGLVVFIVLAGSNQSAPALHRQLDTRPDADPGRQRHTGNRAAVTGTPRAAQEAGAGAASAVRPARSRTACHRPNRCLDHGHNGGGEPYLPADW